MVSNTRPDGKRCPRCRTVKPVGDWPRGCCNDGLDVYCKACKREYNRIRLIKKWMSPDYEADNKRMRSLYASRKNELHTCTKCHETKTLGLFRFSEYNSVLAFSWCRSCESLNRRTRYANHGARDKATRRMRYLMNPASGCECGTPGTSPCTRCSDSDGRNSYEMAAISALRSIGGIGTTEAIALEIGYARPTTGSNREKMMFSATRRLYRALETLIPRGRIREIQPDDDVEVRQMTYALVGG